MTRRASRPHGAPMLWRRALDRLAAHVAPGMGGRPLALTILAALLSIVYVYEGTPTAAPRWFLEASRGLSGVEVVGLHQQLWAHLSAVLLLLAIPLAYGWSVEGWTPRDLGLGVRGAYREIGLVLVLWLAMIPLVWTVGDTPSFRAMYPRLPEAETSARLYLLHEGLYLVKWIAWEFFFRGFLLFGLGRDFLGRAPLVSTLAFTLMHIGKPEPEALGAVVAGLVLCWLALRSRSIWPGVLLHWMVSSTMDFAASTWWR